MKRTSSKVVSSSIGVAIAVMLFASTGTGFGMNETVQFQINDFYYYVGDNSTYWNGTYWYAGNNTIQNPHGMQIAAIKLTVTTLVVGGSSQPVNNGSYIGFCGELQQPIGDGEPPWVYTHTNGPLGSLDSFSAGIGASYGIALSGIGTEKAKLINILFDRHYAGRLASDWDKRTTVAFQLALWEFTHESVGTWTLFDDKSSLATFRNNGYDTNWNADEWEYVSAGVMLGEQYIQDVLAHNPQDYTPTLQIIGLVNEYDQDILIPMAAIPEPRWLLAPGIAAVLFLFRRRRN
jgi:hypothetical protein